MEYQLVYDLRDAGYQQFPVIGLISIAVGSGDDDRVPRAAPICGDLFLALRFSDCGRFVGSYHHYATLACDARS